MARPTVKKKRIKQAAELLENETLTYIFAEREREIYERWKGCETIEKREACYFEITALQGLRDAIYATGTDTD
jgi:hypothetical protein